MENASKALTMAGGVLISLLVISLLVLFYNNLRSLESTKQSSEQVEKAAEFNKDFSAYERNVYGSELLSLINRVEDYNKRQAELEGYQPMEICVNITKNINEKYLKKGKTYKSTEFSSIMKNLENIDKSLITTIKGTVFKFKESKYDQNTGRITQISYEL